MKRLRGNLFTLVSAVSLLLCAATVAAWARSYSRSESITWRSDSLGCGVGMASGSTGICLFSETFRQTDEPLGFWWDSQRQTEQHTGLFHFQYKKVHDTGGFEGWGREVYVPHWVMALLFAAAPACWITCFICRERPRPGFCSNCGYDLRATKDRCPECGTSVAP